MEYKMNRTLGTAKRNKNDEFYTLYCDIEKELGRFFDYNKDIFRDKVVLLPCDDPEYSNFTKYFAQNFERFGLKKLISTSYAQESKLLKEYRPSLLELDNPKFDPKKAKIKVKIFILEKDIQCDGKIDIRDIEWQYLEGDGDFRSREVTKLRDEADIIVTNPPFSLFIDFVQWATEVKSKKFLIIGNINCITYKEVFLKIKNNEAWLGHGMGRWISGFIVPEGYELYGTEARIDSEGNRIVSTNNCLWLTNLEHGKRHSPLNLMSLEDNIKFSKHKEIRGIGYMKYDNYDAIECPYTDAIPSDYEGVIGVPITFLDKYCPEQFKILGCSYSYGDPGCHIEGKDWNVSVKGENVYKRLFIQRV